MTIKGELAVEVEARPQEVFFGKIRLGMEQTRQVTVTYVRQRKRFQDRQDFLFSSNIKVTQVALKDGKPGAMLSVTLLKSMPVRLFDDSIEIATNRQPILVRRFRATSPCHNCLAGEVSFGIVPHGQGAVRIVRFARSGARGCR